MSIIKDQVPISILPIGNGAAGNPPAPSSADYVLVIIWDPGKPGGAGWRTARVTFNQIIMAPPALGINPRIHTGAGTVVVDPNDTYISVEKTVGAPTTVLFPLSVNKNGPCIVKDGKGDADTNPITFTFTGGETCDGMATFQITTAFDEFKVMPRPGGNYWLGK